MLEQIQAPSEDARKVRMMVSAATAAFGLLTSISAGLVVPPGAAVGAVVALVGLGGAALAARQVPRLA